MSYQKNDVLTVKIEDMGHDGEGIGKCEGYTLFVKDTVIGDLAEVKVIKAKKNYGYARLMRLIEPSAHRVEPVCPVARPCGGCQLQMLDYAEQLRFKEKKIVGNLQRIGGMTEIPLEPIMGMEKGACSTTLGPNLTARSSAHHGIVQLVCGRRKTSNAEYDMICGAS